jgi:hypothetical protein
VPPHSLELFVGLSRQISRNSPQLSLDLIGAFLEHFHSYTTQQQEYSLLLSEPWIVQMEALLRSETGDYNQSLKEIKATLRALIRLTYEKPQVFSVSKWS